MKTIVIVGKMGSGKTTIAKELQKYGFQKIRTCTTRKPRNKADLHDYRFLNNTEFQRMESSGVFAETTSFVKNGEIVHYGSLKEDFMNSEKSVIVLDVSGMKNVIQSIGKENLFSVYLKADESTLLSRLNKRGTEAVSTCTERLIKERELFPDDLDADIAIKTDNLRPDQICDKIWQEYRKTSNM